jgi:hypothetical protein
VGIRAGCGTKDGPDEVIVKCRPLPTKRKQVCMDATLVPVDKSSIGKLECLPQYDRGMRDCRGVARKGQFLQFYMPITDTVHLQTQQLFYLL